MAYDEVVINGTTYLLSKSVEYSPEFNVLMSIGTAIFIIGFFLWMVWVFMETGKRKEQKKNIWKTKFKLTDEEAKIMVSS